MDLDYLDAHIKHSCINVMIGTYEDIFSQLDPDPYPIRDIDDRVISFIEESYTE